MRCPDCGKFVSMDNGDPELDLSCSFQTDAFHVDGTIHLTRNCADCGTELKSLDVDADVSADFSEFEGWADLGSKEKEAVAGSFMEDPDGFEFEPGDAEVSESGGGRYQKNLITVNASFTITVPVPDSEKKLVYHGNISEENPASAFDESC